MANTYRYYPSRGLRLKSKPYGQFEGQELRSEDFDNTEEFVTAIAADIYSIIVAEEEYTEAREGETNE